MRNVATVVAVMLLVAGKAEAANEPLTVRPVHLKCHHDGYVVDVTYPHFCGGGPGVAAELNRLAKHEVNTNIPAREGDGGRDNQYSCTFKTRRLSGKLVSIDFQFAWYEGGAHDFEFHQPFNYRIDPNVEEIAITDLVIKPFPQKRLSRLIARELQQTKTADVIEKTEFNARELSNFTITRRGLVFTFNEYLIGPYAIGCPTATVTFKQLEPFLADGVL